MPNYMLLLYAPEPQAAKAAELLECQAIFDDLSEAGMLVSASPLRPAPSATTVRVRGGETELTDGPFAVTKEMLVGYYLLECRDLDQALEQAQRLPVARYGSVEVRRTMALSEIPTEGQVALPAGRP
jgi:hypothetical protein